MFHNHNENAGRGNSDCSFTVRAIQKNFPNIVSGQMIFDEEQATREDYQNMLIDIKKQSRSELKTMNQYGVNISGRHLHNSPLSIY